MLKPIKFESKVKIENLPLQWIPKFELYYPDLPQFPMVYIHILVGDTRIYGFPASLAFEIKENNKCDIEILFLSNVDLEKNEKLKTTVKNELEERFGSSNKIGITDIVNGCKGNKKYEDFFIDLWKCISKSYGENIPYGKFYEEIYSIVRFVSAWQPKTGRQSEMRMLYNFLSIFGEYVPVEGKWDHLDFFLIPSYQDVSSKNFPDFPRFKNLFDSMEKIWNIYFIKVTKIDGVMIRSMKESWPQAKDDFIEEVSYPLFTKGKINLKQKEAIERLVDAFNRHSWRAAFFIWSIMTIFEKDYRTWNKDFFVKFYLNRTNDKNGVGISPKVIACFLQQGFRNDEVIPVDTWVESFYESALGIKSLDVFFNSFTKLGKIERAIWLSSQANKTNIKTFFDTLWCTRFGVTGNRELRGNNPISCYECKLRNTCPGYIQIKDKKVLIKDKSKGRIEDILTKKGNFKGKKIISKTIIIEAEANECTFICLTEEKVPKKVFRKVGEDWKLIDEFSGYILTDQKLKSDDSVLTSEQMIKQMPAFSYAGNSFETETD